MNDLFRLTGSRTKQIIFAILVYLSLGIQGDQIFMIAGVSGQISVFHFQIILLALVIYEFLFSINKLIADPYFLQRPLINARIQSVRKIVNDYKSTIDSVEWLGSHNKALLKGSNLNAIYVLSSVDTSIELKNSIGMLAESLADIKISYVDEGSARVKFPRERLRFVLKRLYYLSFNGFSTVLFGLTVFLLPLISAAALILTWTIR